MKAETLAEIVRTLTPEEQAAVREFIDFLKHKTRPSSDGQFLAAIEEFMDEHPDLLRRLAQ
jgi:hypothetical protein